MAPTSRFVDIDDAPTAEDGATMLREDDASSVSPSYQWMTMEEARRWTVAAWLVVVTAINVAALVGMALNPPMAVAVACLLTWFVGPLVYFIGPLLAIALGYLLPVFTIGMWTSWRDGSYQTALTCTLHVPLLGLLYLNMWLRLGK